MDSTNQQANTQGHEPGLLMLDLNALPNEPRIDRALNRYVRALGSDLKKEDRHRVPGAAVMVRHGNQVVHLNGYGYANLETEQKITPATIFDLGSLSKQFTAAAVLDLVAAKKLALTDNISTFFKDFPRYADAITVDQLIHHTSALPDYIDIHVAARQAEEDWETQALVKSDDWYPEMSNRQKRELTNKDAVSWIASQKLLHRQPDTDFEYSNSGYVVLAALVEKVTKRRFSDYLKHRIFESVGMDATYVFDENSRFAYDAPEVVNHARCYNRLKGETFVPVGYTPLNFIYGDGNVHSTILDLAKWDWLLHRFEYAAICTKEELDKTAVNSFRELLWGPVRLKNRRRVDYGAGWNLRRNKYEDEVEENGKRVTKNYESRAEYHRGIWLGWRSYFARAARWVVPEAGEDIDPSSWESLGIVVLCNNKQLNPCRIAKYISHLYWGTLKKDNIMNSFNCLWQ